MPIVSFLEVWYKMCINIKLQKLILTRRPVWSGFQADIEIYPGKLDQSRDRILFSHITNL